MNNIHRIYTLLIDELGPQRWWPTTLKSEIHPTYHGKKPLTEKQLFEICIGAILTQNTSWKNVEKAITNLNKNNLVDINKIKSVNERKLASLIKSSGYYNQKAKKLKHLSNFLIKNCNGNIKRFFNKDITLLRKELLSIKGVGPETADSIILYAAEKPVFVIDAYTKRIFSRLGFCKADVSYDELQNLFHKNLKKNHKLFNEYHALIVELGKNYCRKKPLCSECILTKLCKNNNFKYLRN
jgi:endonuclease-3 related protein